MMKNKIIIIISILSLAWACTDDFEEINADPNSMTKAPLDNILASTQLTLANRYGGTALTYPAVYVGYASNYRYIDEVTYSTSGPGSPWDYLYVNVLTNLNYIIDNADGLDNPNIKAAAMVLKAYAFQLLVDMYGPIPYSQANKGLEGVIFPAFDNEKDIYYDLLHQLRIANNLFDDDALYKIGVEDQLYGGKTDQWQKFCNSLRLRIAIRMSNVPEAQDTAINNLNEILSNPDKFPIMASNADNAKFDFPDEDPNYREPWSSYSGTSQYRIGKPLVDKLLELNDPRIHKYADSLNNGDYVGIEIGGTSSSGISKIHDRFVKNDGGIVNFLKYSEVEFIKAEAFARNLVSGNAQESYESGITAALEEFNISTDTITTYIGETGVTWINDVNQIYTQKWLSLFHQSWEAWAEMRRTDIPTLGLAIGHNLPDDKHNRVPFRFNYPSFVKSNNGDNIPAFVTEDDYYWGYQIWWDTRTGVQ